MVDKSSLEITYSAHAPVKNLIDLVTFCVESVSLEFERWDDPYVQGPGLYFVIIAGSSLEKYADPMGTNRWPIEDADVVSEDLDAFFETAREVAIENDGGVVISVDGTIHEQMVRFKDLSSDKLAEHTALEEIKYADWMGARHMSAVDTSARKDVIAAITLSEENGRVTRFRDGEYTSYQRDELGEQWRGED